jgi:hypothetical protein
MRCITQIIGLVILTVIVILLGALLIIYGINFFKETSAKSQEKVNTINTKLLSVEVAKVYGDPPAILKIVVDNIEDNPIEGKVVFIARYKNQDIATVTKYVRLKPGFNSIYVDNSAFLNQINKYLKKGKIYLLIQGSQNGVVITSSTVTKSLEFSGEIPTPLIISPKTFENTAKLTFIWQYFTDSNCSISILNHIYSVNCLADQYCGNIDLTLNEGEYDYNIICRYSSTKSKVIIDLTPPDINLISPVSTTVKTLKVTFKWNVKEKYLKNCDLYIDGIKATTLVCTNCSYTYMLSSEGTHTWRVICYDYAGNYNYKTATFDVNLNPFITIISPKDNEIINSKTVTFKWKLDVASDCNLVIDSQSYYFPTNTTFEYTTTLSSGTHQYFVKCKDSNTGIITFYVGEYTITATIINKSDTLYDYPVKIEVPSDISLNDASITTIQFENDFWELLRCNNIVIYDETNKILDFWVENCNPSNKKLIIWVKIPILYGGSQKRIYIGLTSEPTNLGNDASKVFSPGGGIFHTQYCNKDPTSYEDIIQMFRAGIQGTGYCTKVIDSFVSLSNHSTCGGKKNYILYYYQAIFYANTEGTWCFRAGIDFGKGGGMYLDDMPIHEIYNDDLWWAHNWNNTTDILSGCKHLKKGWHILEIYGVEWCCDGDQTIQYKSPKDSIWKDLANYNILLYHQPTPIKPKIEVVFK